MNHSWILDGVECNFCTKCGIKKSKASSSCIAFGANIKLKILHKVKDISSAEHAYWKSKKFTEEINNLKNFQKNLSICEHCNLSNKKYGRYCIDFSEKENKAYVIYYKHKSNSKDGKIKNWFVDTSSTYRSIKRTHRKFFNDMKCEPKLYLHEIHCPYTEEDVLLKNIVL